MTWLSVIKLVPFDVRLRLRTVCRALVCSECGSRTLPSVWNAIAVSPSIQVSSEPNCPGAKRPMKMAVWSSVDQQRCTRSPVVTE
jgi:hypothetical protein